MFDWVLNTPLYGWLSLLFIFLQHIHWIIHLWIAKRSANAATVFSPPDKLSIGRNLEVDKIYIKAYKQSVDYLQHLIPHV